MKEKNYNSNNKEKLTKSHMKIQLNVYFYIHLENYCETLH